jgi:fatty-acyl-CoA synthase
MIKVESPGGTAMEQTEPGNPASLAAQARRHSVADLLHRTAQREPGRTAIVYRDLRQSYAELDTVVSRTAGALAARGVAAGDRIAIFSHNNHAFVVCYFALARLGAVSVPINFMLGPG